MNRLHLSTRVILHRRPTKSRTVKQAPIWWLSISTIVLLVVVTFAPASSAADDCGREEAVRAVKDFIRAYNRGDLDRLHELVADDPDFRRYRVMPLERPFPLSDDRATLTDYFRKRIELSDHLELRNLRVSQTRNNPGGYGFDFRIVRTNRDTMPYSKGGFDGKGSVGCSITFWNMGADGP